MLINDVVINKVFILKNVKIFRFGKVILEKWDSASNSYRLRSWSTFFSIISLTCYICERVRGAPLTLLPSAPANSSCLTVFQFQGHYLMGPP